MISPRVTRALNPHRKLSLAQIRAGFGGKRRQASLKAKRHTHKAPKRRKAAAASNPKKKKRRATAKRRNAQKKVVYRTRYKTRTVTKKVYVKPKRRAKAKRRNPLYLATLAPVGAGNPHRKKRRKSNMAKTKRRASGKGRSGKRKNPTRRRSVARRGSHRPRSRNPFDTGLAKGIVGGAVAFSIGKKVPPMLGATANSSAVMSLATTAGVGLATYWAAKKFAPAFAHGAAIGAGMAVLNVAINAWAPALQGYSALGDFVRLPNGYPLPYNAFTGMGVPAQLAPAMAAPPATQTSVNMGAWGLPWGQ